MTQPLPSSQPPTQTDLPAAQNKPPFNEISALFPLLTLYTATYMALVAADFFLKLSLQIPDGVMPVYIALLGAYAADKEIRRWVGMPEPPRKGSLFVYLWIIMFLLMVICSVFHDAMPMPEDVTKVVLQVLGIFFGAKASKYAHERRTSSKPAATQITNQQDRILSLLRQKNGITRAELEEKLGLSSRSVNRLLASMLESSLIKQEGSGKATNYKLVEHASATQTNDEH